MNSITKKDIEKLALVGQPNSGKTTLFNWLTGFKNRTVNYPGSTVFVSSGNLSKKYQAPDEISIQLTDTPGCYSLTPKSADEEVTKKYLLNEKNLQTVICVLDGSKLEAQLPLFFQLKEAGFKIIIALTMWDLISQQNLDLKKLEQELAVPVIPINGLIGEGVWDLVKKALSCLKAEEPKTVSYKIEDWTVEQISKASKQAKKIYLLISNEGQKNKKNLFVSEKFDRVLLSPKTGLLLLGVIMFGLFSSLFWLADPFMGYVDSFFSVLIDKTYSINPDSMIVDFVANGVFASFGAVLVFVPQIFILFVGISLLEDTGYLARAVSLLDGPFSKIGLTGRSFIPFLSGYACAIPAVMAARNLSSPREKLLTFFAVPFMSCSARLPVYALLLSALFYGQSAWKPGLALSIIYVGSFLLGVFCVALLNLFIKQKKQRPFLIDLPIYRRPVLMKTLYVAWTRTKHYIFKAGPAIFVVALIIWVMISFPRNLELTDSQQIQASYAGQLGKIIEPVFEFMGVDWRVGVGLIAAFAAREVFVSALVLVFNISDGGTATALSASDGLSGVTDIASGIAPGIGTGVVSDVGAGVSKVIDAAGTGVANAVSAGTDDISLTNSLLENMRTAVHANGELVFTTASIIALIVFFMVALQCVTTTAIIYKESKSLKLALIQLVSLNVLAYVLAVITYQTFKFIG